MRRLRYLHPFLISLLPVVSLLGHNIHEIQLASAGRPLVTFIALPAFLVLAARLITKDWGRATLIASLLLLVLTSYGHLYAFLKQYEVAGVILGRHRFLLPLALAAVIGSIWLILRTGRAPHNLHWVLTISSFAAVLIPLFQITTFVLQQPQRFSIETDPSNPITSSPQSSEDSPDIYYIILDAYARADTLESWFEYDNSEFLSALEERSFYVADQSNSNYFGTAVSLASSLNMNYLQDLDIDLDQGIYPSNLREPIRHSAVRQRLEALGYATVAFPTDYYPTDLDDADYYLRPGLTPLQRFHITGRLNAFEGLLVRGTIAQAFLDLQILRESEVGTFIQEQLDEPRQQRREIVLSTLRLLETVPQFEEPTFTFAHILIPHGPYIFDRNGDIVSTEELESRTGSHIADNNDYYLHQLIYTSQLITETVDTILSASNSPPIIIIQSDHGPEPDMDWTDPDPDSLKARMAILNAYHVPENCREELYTTITPVNTFRVLFDCMGYMEAHPLVDRSYYSNLRSRSEKLDFIPVETLLED